MARKKSMRVLMTNDDGIQADGLQALRRAVEARGLAVTVVAPASGVSACSRSISMHRPLTCVKRGENQYAVDGTPTDCVLLALYEIFRGDEPGLVLSGINHGRNLGDDITYSGTCAGAMEGAMVGLRAAALSAMPDASGECRMVEAAAYFAEHILDTLLSARLPQWCFYNVNFPAVRSGKFRGVKITPAGRSTYVDPIVRVRHPRDGSRRYWIAGSPKTIRRRGTDIEAVERGYVAVTPVRLDLNDPKLIARTRRAFR